MKGFLVLSVEDSDGEETIHLMGMRRWERVRVYYGASGN